MLNRNLISEISNQSKDLRKIFLASSFSYKELFLCFPQHITLFFFWLRTSLSVSILTVCSVWSLIASLQCR